MGILTINQGILSIEQGGSLSGGGDPAIGNCVLPNNYIDDVLSDSPMGYWQLNNPQSGASSVMIDSSGNGYNGNALAVGTGIVFQSPGPFGIGDCCWNKENVGAGNSYITFPTTDFDSVIGQASQSFTMEIWQRAPVSGSGNPNTFFDKTDTNPHNWNTMQILTDGRFNVQLYDGSNNPSINSTISIEGTAWYHLVLVRNTGTQQILSYINGNLVGSSNVANSVETSNNTKLCIGARQAGGDRFINHSVAHAAVYDTALSEQRIESHFSVGSGNP